MWYLLPPADTKDGLNTTNMESLKSLDVTSVRGPCFAAVQQHGDTDSLVDSHLGGDGKITVVEEVSSQRRSASQLNSQFQFLLFSMCESITLVYELWFLH